MTVDAGLAITLMVVSSALWAVVGYLFHDVWVEGWSRVIGDLDREELVELVERRKPGRIS